MATLKIWETVRDTSGIGVVRLDERTNYQTVSFTGTAGASAAFDADTSIIAISADVACAVRVGAVGTTPTAVATDFPVAANTLTYFAVLPGAKISAVTV